MVIFMKMVYQKTGILRLFIVFSMVGIIFLPKQYIFGSSSGAEGSEQISESFTGDPEDTSSWPLESAEGYFYLEILSWDTLCRNTYKVVTQAIEGLDADPSHSFEVSYWIDLEESTINDESYQISCKEGRTWTVYDGYSGFYVLPLEFTGKPKGYRLTYIDSIDYDYGNTIEAIIDAGEETFLVYMDTNNIGHTTYGDGIKRHHAYLFYRLEPIHYRIGYGLNGGKNNEANPSSYTVNDNIKIFQPTRDGYWFAGWYVMIDANLDEAYEETYIVEPTQTYDEVLTGSVGNRYYEAAWNLASYAITYDLDGGKLADGKTNPTNYTIETETFQLNNPVKEGYFFAGWTGSNGSEPQAEVKVVKGTTGDKFYQAVWIPIQYKIRFDGNGAVSGSMEDLTAVYGQDTILPTNAFKRENEYGESMFKGWNIRSDTKSVLYPNEAVVRNLISENGGMIILYAIWDDCPGMDTCDLYYTLEQAQSGYITEMELLSQARAFDLEDGDIAPGTHSDTGNSFRIIDYAESDFTQFVHEGSVTETFKVIDSSKNSSKQQITVYIVDTAPDIIVTTSDETENEGTTRFINEKYYNLPYSSGGLEEHSIWKCDPQYRASLEGAFLNQKNSTPEQIVVLTHEEIADIKAFIRENGIGNTKSPDALERFYKKFIK